MFEESCILPFEPSHEKTYDMGFRPGQSQTDLYSPGSRLKASNFGSKKKRACTICVAKTKMLISCAVTAQLICVFVFDSFCAFEQSTAINV